jgi:hypothetical protein
VVEVAEDEILLSAQLNRLIGELNCEVELFPRRSEPGEYARAHAKDSLDRCGAILAKLTRCVAELLDRKNIDAYSRIWIGEALESAGAANAEYTKLARYWSFEK